MRGKKLFIIIGILLVLCLILFIIIIKKTSYKTTPLLEMKQYSNLKKEDIKQITIMKEQEGGVESILEDQKNDINKTYELLNNIEVGKTTKKTCDDNTTRYIIELNDGSIVEIVVECDWVVIDDKRYLIK